VQRLFTAFPAGQPGAGLLLLRSAVGLIALVEGAGALPGGDQVIGAQLSLAAGGLAVVGGALLVAGFLTPIAGVLSGLGILLLADGPLRALVVIVAAAVVLLGPGAFSVDSRLFGRREVVIPRRNTEIVEP
jgi:hypothetical protein